VKAAALKVQSAIRRLGLAREVVELHVHARTSQQAADALGVAVGQIAKSLVFTVNHTPILVIASGANRVDEDKLGAVLGGTIRRADPETVRQATGYAIGGVAPLGHPQPLPVYIDRDLLQYPLVYAAAGVPECVFPLTADELIRATGGRVLDMKDAATESASTKNDTTAPPGRPGGESGGERG
jgi:prolyl-tRNA editing enzyme YbaK/EbsC (Cys-tRNA(Pro) deacylase)